VRQKLWEVLTERPRIQRLLGGAIEGLVLESETWSTSSKEGTGNPVRRLHAGQRLRTRCSQLHFNQESREDCVLPHGERHASAKTTGPTRNAGESE